MGNWGISDVAPERFVPGTPVRLLTERVVDRPDGEDFGQPTADEIAEACAARDMSFFHIPVDRSGLTKNMVDNFHGAVTQSAGKVLAYCRSGQRSSMLWQACGSP